ncbi:MAG: hypothetical protein Q7R85_03395 [bacterium]|nr:hypothetical protein [bacterium]
MHAFVAVSDQAVFAGLMVFWFLLWAGMAVLVTWGCRIPEEEEK